MVSLSLSLERERLQKRETRAPGDANPTTPALKHLAKATSQAAVIEGLVRFGEAAPVIVAKFALALKALYDADILDEETILHWHDAQPPDSPDAQDDAQSDAQHAPRHLAAARLAAAPFVRWLREAEEDSEGD